jgi:DNA mismatch repair protein MutS2
VFVTTHFLTFAAELAESPPAEGMEFLQAAIDERNRPTYSFVPGVAKTSLAAETAARLGVTLEELAGLVARKRASAEPEQLELPDELRTLASFEPERR